MNPTLTFIFAAAAGVCVADIYYAQPLLDILASEFHLPTAAAGGVVTATQLGSVLALVFLLPLGDIWDKRRLLLALTNVLSNALKHSPPSGVVTVRAWKDDAGAHFLVRDQGPGFPPEDAHHLFDKYFRSTAERHRKIPGSGLGLYIVRTIAQRHGGDVTARSEAGNGAEFEITIPLGG